MMTDHSTRTSWPSGDAIADLIRDLDWGATPLGQIAGWPQSLKTTVDMLLRLPAPAALFWASDGIMLVNQAMVDLAEMAASELLGRSVLEAWPKDADFNRIVLDVCLAGRSLSYRDQKFSFVRDGLIAPRWYDLTYSPVLGETGDPAGVLAIMVETTERVEAEQALRTSEDRYRTLAELVPDLLWQNDSAGYTRWFNRRWYEYTGQTFEEAREYGWVEAIHPDEREAARVSYADRVRAGDAIRHERRIRGADGVWRWFLVQASPVRDASGSILQWFGAATDIHEQRVALEAAEQARLEADTARQAAEIARAEADAARDYLHNVVAAVPAAIAVLSGRQGVFRLVNPAFERGAIGRELLGRTYHEAFPEFDNQPIGEQFNRVLETGERVSFPEFHIVIDRDGQPMERFINTTWVPLRDGHGLVSEVLTVSIDVTDQVRQRQRIEELRQEADVARAALEEAHRDLEARVTQRTLELEQAKVRLEAEVAERRRVEAARSILLQRLVTAEEDERRRIAYELHDGVTQLASAAGLHLDELASRHPELPADDNFELDRARALIRRAVEECRQLITGLRPAVLDDFGLARAIRQESEALADLGWTVQVVDRLGPERLPANIEITLFRVAQEALTNVRRHAGLTTVDVLIARDDTAIQLVVRDWGQGFAAIDSLSATDRSGHVGLAAIRERIELLGGNLTIASQPGAGTEIRVTVPLAEEE